MKIAHISTVHPAFDGRIFHKECTTLAQAGHDVHLIIQHTKAEVVNGVKIVPLPKFSNRINRIIEGNKLALQRALEIDAQVYHFHDPELLPVGLKLKKQGYYSQWPDEYYRDVVVSREEKYKKINGGLS